MRNGRWCWTLLLAALAGSVWAGRAEAQVFTPTFMAPRSSSDTGLYLNDGPGDFSIEGILRRATSSGFDVGLRLGFADLENAAVLVGGELRNPLSLGTAPLDLALTAGAQGVLGDDDAIGLQVGLSIGHTFAAPELSITPYLHPRLVFIEGFGEDSFDSDLAADLGVDLALSPQLVVRAGFGIEKPGADWGIGLAWRP